MKWAVSACAMMIMVGNAAGQWRLQSIEDKMSGKPTRLAVVKSADSLSLDFPYKGENRGELAIRQHPAHGLDVIFTVDKGQIICSRISSCEVVVKFDDKPPMKFGANGPDDHSSTVLFLRDAKRFIAQAKDAKVILVQATYYKAGGQVLTFSTPGGLQW